MDWNLQDVRSWIEQVEQCPRGSVGDGYAKDINQFLNDIRQGGLWKAHGELCKRGQEAVIQYHKRRKE